MKIFKIFKINKKIIKIYFIEIYKKINYLIQIKFNMKILIQFHK